MDMKYFTGTAYSIINNRLSIFEPYRMFRAGLYSRDAYVSWLEDNQAELLHTGLNEDQIQLSGRFPENEIHFVNAALAQLSSVGVLKTSVYDETKFESVRKTIYETFDHSDRLTYIFPEEERLTFAIANILKPKTIGAFGSYYGYWSIWALCASESLGVLVDLNEQFGVLACQNLSALGLDGRVLVETGDAIRYLEETSDVFDLALVDAEGPESHLDSDYRKKYVYYPIFRSLYSRLADEAVVLAHNILLENFSSSTYFEKSVSRNQEQFSKLLPFIKSNFSRECAFSTSEGLGVFKK